MASKRTPKARLSLAEQLRALEQLLASRRPEALRELAKGASNAGLAKLSQRVFAGEPVPAELETWFRWHDGQKGTTPPNPEDNRTLLSINEAIRAYQFWRDEAQSDQPAWPASWVPLFENGAGDYVVYDCSAAGAGALVAFWHDERGYWQKPRARWRAWKSLAAWAADVAATLAELEPVSEAPKRARERKRPTLPREWTRVTRRPSLAALTKAVVGTTYLCRSFSWIQPHLAFRVFIKREGDAWAEGIGAKLERAFADALGARTTRDTASIRAQLNPSPQNDAPPAHMKHLKPVPRSEIGLFVAK
jgi:cell wall assembly regulator SMI1